MAFTIKLGDATITADTAKEAAELMAELGLKPQEVNAPRALPITFPPGFKLESQELIGGFGRREYGWTPELFQRLIDRLGAPQKKTLALIVRKGVISDEDLRTFLGVPNNQALAGVLSGISKQSMGLMIQPREIFSYENSRSGGKRRSDYRVADGLKKIAAQLNWPTPDLLPKVAK